LKEKSLDLTVWRAGCERGKGPGVTTECELMNMQVNLHDIFQGYLCVTPRIY